MKHAIYSQNKKLLLSLAVVAGGVFLVFVGTLIHGAITNDAEQRARLYQTALQTSNDKELNYSIDTKQGYVFASVTIKQVDTVKFPEMNKEFPSVEKVEETYTEHEREECTYDDEGNEKECHTEYYYEWDQTDKWSLSGNTVTMADRQYPIGLFALKTSPIDAKEIVNGQDGKYVYERTSGGFFGRGWFSSDSEGDKRFYYRVMTLPQSGTVFLKLSEGVQAAFGGKIELDSRDAKTTVSEAQKKAQSQGTAFTVLWAILVLSELLGLGYVVWFQEKYS